MSIFTLFAANVVVLLVTALAFGAAWHGQPGKPYWRSWIAANFVLAAALLLLMFAPSNRSDIVIAVGNCLLVAGFGFRWRAARQFAMRAAPLAPTLGPALVAIGLFSLPTLLDHRSTYTAINVLLTAQTLATGYEFWRDRQDDLPSRYGLVLTYFLMAASFAARVGQGLIFTQDFGSYLPQDRMLEFHLYVALVYTTGSAAFLLSLVYERGALDLRRAALTDPLTALPNRRAFEARLEEYLARNDRSFAIILIDIDHFKAVNDRYGHASGDIALRACADICAQQLRSSDFIARIGGEEFAAILRDADASAAYEATDRIRSAVEAHHIRSHGQTFRLTLSAGMVHAARSAGGFDDLMRKADAALYRAKGRGRNRIEQAAA